MWDEVHVDHNRCALLMQLLAISVYFGLTLKLDGLGQAMSAKFEIRMRRLVAQLDGLFIII